VKGTATEKVWFYQLDPGRSMGKTSALNDGDLSEFITLQSSFADSDKSWSVDVSDIDEATCDLSIKNPNKTEEALLREPQEILAEIAALDAESDDILGNIRSLL
jgi:type I restriction enzyme M protein